MDENSSVLPLSDASMERGPGGEVYFQRSLIINAKHTSTHNTKQNVKDFCKMHIML
jgi:hypothetical protein